MGNALKDLGIQPVRMIATGVEPWSDSVVLRQQSLARRNLLKPVLARISAFEYQS